MAAPRLSPHATGILLALAGAITFSGKAIIVKLSYRYGVDAVAVIMVRMLWSLPMFMALAWWSSRTAFAQQNPLQWRDAPIIIALGVLGYYLASFLDFLGLQTITASLERLILYLNPTLVLLLSALIYKHRIRPMRALAMVISYAGVLVVFGHEVSLAGPDVVTGALFVLGSALSYALYLMFSGEVVQRIGSMRLVGWASSVACVCCLAQFALLRPLDTVIPSEVWWLGLLNATACTVAPVWMVMLAIERIGAALTSQTGMVGPLSTLTLGVWVLGEPLNAWIGLGTVLVLGGVYLASRYGDKSWT
ncbi:MAG: DMT family transporter [Betaproteobacteria bacterium]|nr:DMT family transporter [Betaproteobacteria bacterium]